MFSCSRQTANSCTACWVSVVTVSWYARRASIVSDEWGRSNQLTYLKGVHCRKRKNVSTMPDEADRLRTLLRSWGLGAAAIQKFIDDDITISSLRTLSDASIKELLPTRGPRDAFRFKWVPWKQKAVELDEVQSDCEVDEDLPPSKKAKLDSEAVLTEVKARPIVNDLHKYLKGTIPGLTILGFVLKNGELDNYCRDLLSQQVIYRALEGDFERSLQRPDLSGIADEIVELFPSESKETWYDVVKKGKCTVVEGRLRFKYYNVRGSLYKSSLISRKSLEKDQEIDEGKEPQPSTDFRNILSLDFESHSAVDVHGVWASERDARFRFRNVVSVTDYVAHFPVLKQPLGWTLIAKDGIHRVPSLEYMHTFWDEYSDFLLGLIRKKKRSFLKVPLTVEKGEEGKIDEYKFLAIILEMPTLFRVRTVPKPKIVGKSKKASKSDTDKKQFRPSIPQVRNALCTHITDISLLDEVLNQRRDKLLQFHHTLQPTAVVVGSLEKIRQCFIVLDDQRWEVDTPSAAVWGVIKLCFGLHASYPLEARHIFLFIQQSMLQLELPEDYEDDAGLRSFIASHIKQYKTYLESSKK